MKKTISCCGAVATVFLAVALPQHALTAQYSPACAAMSSLYARLNSISTAQKPRVTAIAVVGNFAYANFVWGEGGGPALLSRDAAGWHVIRAGGGDEMSPEILQAFGVPAGTATELRSIVARHGPVPACGSTTPPTSTPPPTQTLTPSPQPTPTPTPYVRPTPTTVIFKHPTPRPPKIYGTPPSLFIPTPTPNSPIYIGPSRHRPTSAPTATPTPGPAGIFRLPAGLRLVSPAPASTSTATPSIMMRRMVKHTPTPTPSPVIHAR